MTLANASRNSLSLELCLLFEIVHVQLSFSSLFRFYLTSIHKVWCNSYVCGKVLQMLFSL